MAVFLTKCRERLIRVLLIKGIERNTILPSLSLLSSLHIKTKIMMTRWEQGKTYPCLCLELYFLLGFTAGALLWRLKEKHGIVLGACGSLMNADPTLKEKCVYIILSPIGKTMPTQLVGSLTSNFLCQNKLQLGTQCSCLIYYLSQDCWHIHNPLAVPS